MIKWSEFFGSGALVECGKDCGSIAQLASAVSVHLDRYVSHDALFNAHKRHKGHLKLRGSLMDYMGKAHPAPNAKGKVLSMKPPKPPKPGDVRFELSSARRKALKKAKRFIITASLNNSALDHDVWGALKLYAKRNAAEIIVLPVRYKNPTSRVDGKIIDEGAWWPKEVIPYMTDELLELHEHFWVMGHVRVQATAVTPLTGLESLSRSASAVFGHGQLSMSMVPTPQNKLPKVLYTTGCVSEPNYSDTRAGIKGDFHHGKGAVVVELDGPRFHVRGLVADDEGGFYDVDRYYTAKSSRKSKGALALITGDEHAVFNDPECKKATYLNRDSIVHVTRPKDIVRHDVFDGYSINHHSRKNTVTQIAKHQSGHNDLYAELRLTVDHIDSTTPKWAKNLIVSSNHHDHLLQWMRETTPLEEPWNAEMWVVLWSGLMPTIGMGAGGAECADPFRLWAEARLKSNTEFLDGDSGRTIAGIAVDMHGHRGSNGSRGSIRQFTKIGIKTVIGHSHTPGIMKGCYQVGTSSQLKLEYTSGPSSWAHCHCLIHPNGKRQLIFVVSGRWRKGDLK